MTVNALTHLNRFVDILVPLSAIASGHWPGKISHIVGAAAHRSTCDDPGA
jgi:hypothetical protein